MRIIYFLPDIDAGVSRIVKNLLKYRPVNNNIVYSVVLFACYDDSVIDAGIDFNADEIVRFGYSKFENVWSIFKRMSKLIKNENDIIVGNDGFELKMVSALKLNNPVYYILHGDFSYYYSIVKLYGSVVSRFITYSNKIEKEVKEILGKEEHNRVVKIYYPVPIFEIQNIICRNSDNSFKILFASLLIERKGADLLPTIYDLLIKKGVVNFELEIIGDGELFKLLDNKFKNIDNVKLSGWKNNNYVLQQMKESQIFLFPSRLEGLPNVLVEALSAGIVPICNNLESGINDIIVDGKNGLLTTLPNAENFADAIITLYKNPQTLHLLKNNNINALDKFEAYKQAKAYEQCFLEKRTEVLLIIKKNPTYIKGRILDIAWIPNLIVIILRKIFLIPEL